MSSTAIAQCGAVTRVVLGSRTSSRKRTTKHALPRHNELTAVGRSGTAAFATRSQRTSTKTRAALPIKSQAADVEVVDAADVEVKDESPFLDPSALSAQEIEAAFAPMCLDPDGSVLAASEFPIPPEELILKTKQFLLANLGEKDPDLMAEDFSAMLPVVGPIAKEPFVKIFGGFGIRAAFPDFKENYFGFTVDPSEPSRVWFMSRSVGTNTEPLWNGLEPTGKVVEVCPTVSSCIFDEAGKVLKFTTGYPVDREAGNTGGMSAAFGIIYALKPGFLPFPEAQPYKPSWQFKLAGKLGVLGGRVVGRKEEGAAKAGGTRPLSDFLSMPVGALLLAASAVAALVQGSVRAVAAEAGAGAALVALGAASAAAWKQGHSIKPLAALSSVLTAGLAALTGMRWWHGAGLFPAGLVAVLSGGMAVLYARTVLSGADPLKKDEEQPEPAPAAAA